MSGKPPTVNRDNPTTVTAAKRGQWVLDLARMGVTGQDLASLIAVGMPRATAAENMRQWCKNLKKQ